MINVRFYTNVAEVVACRKAHVTLDSLKRVCVWGGGGGNRANMYILHVYTEGCVIKLARV